MVTTGDKTKIYTPISEFERMGAGNKSVFWIYICQMQEKGIPVEKFQRRAYLTIT